MSTSSDQKQFQELLLERTKALAQVQAQQQSEAIKSSSSDGKHKPLASHYFSLSAKAPLPPKLVYTQSQNIFETDTFRYYYVLLRKQILFEIILYFEY